MPRHSTARTSLRFIAIQHGAATLFVVSVGSLVSVSGCTSDAQPAPTPQGGAAALAGSAGTPSAGTPSAGSGGQGGSIAQAGSAGNGGGSAGNSSAGNGGGSAGGPAGARGYYSTNRDEFLGAPRCASLGAQLCDDFESGTFDSAIWELHSRVTGDAPVIDSVHAARGTKAAHFHATTNNYSYILEQKTFPAVGNVFWGRMFLYIDVLPVTPDGAHFTLVEGAGTGDTSKVREGGQFRRFGAGTDGGPSGDWTNIDKDPSDAAAKQVPEKQWVCVEWQYKGDTDETHFYWDGVEHPTLHTFPAVAHGGNSTVPYHLPQFTSVWLGWWMYQADPSPDHFDVWIDEVAIDQARIGCSL